MPQAAMPPWDKEVDLLVFGSGAAGLMAAFVGAQEGLQVLLCEKSSCLGGTTATSGGSLWIPNAPPIRRNGKAEDIQRARRYLEGELGDYVRYDLLDAYLDGGPAAIEYLERHSDVKFQHVENPDYHSDASGGSSFGRAITTMEFDAGKLPEEDFALLRPPRDIYMILGGMMVGRREVPMLIWPFASLKTFAHVVMVLSAHALARLRRPRGTRLLLGNALVARFLSSLRKKHVQIAVNAPLTQLLRGEGGVEGAVVAMNDSSIRIRARRGVVLATGGIAHSQPLRDELMKDFPHRNSFAFEGNTGDAVTAARAAGGMVDAAVSNPGYWSPMSVRESAGGGRIEWIHGHMDRGKPGLIAVNRSGRRFVNESNSYHDFVLGQFKCGTTPEALRAWLVCDHRFIREYGLGLVRPRISLLKPYITDGYLRTAGTIRDLAVEIGVDPDVLTATIAECNRDAGEGVDRLFGRGSSAFNRFNGDANVQPNPCMKAIVTPPFYAVAVHPCTIGTTLGLMTDRNAAVLDHEGRRIDGLYACGNDMSSVMRGFYPGPGITLGPAITFSFRAVMDMTGNPAYAQAGSSRGLQ